MNKIYFISQYFVPLGRAHANRAFMVKYFHEAGWDIEVVAGKDHKSFILSFQEDRSLKQLIPSEIKIHQFSTRSGWFIYDVKKLLHRPVNLRNNWIKEAENRLTLDQKGIIYAIVPPLDNAVLAHKLACKYYCPLVLHYVDEDVEVGTEIFRRADLIICVTQQIKTNLSRRYNRENIFVAENGYLQEIHVPDQKPLNLPIRMIYAGSMTFRTRPEIFAQAYCLLAQKDPSVTKKLLIDFFGPPNYYPLLFLKKHLMQNMQFKGFLAFNDLMNTFQNYDIALASTKGEISFTSKIYQYLNAGLPIVTSSDDSCLKEFIETQHIGLATSRRVTDVADKFKELIDNPERILDLRKNVLAIKPHYSFRNRIGEISHLLKDKFQH
jgi:glycosyltransferase involved in cell wall biosynthesis